MTELETHIEKKIPFVLYNTKEGAIISPFTFYPGEMRIQAPTDGDGVSMSAVFKTEAEFIKEMERIKAGKENFQSLRPNKNEKTN